MYQALYDIALRLGLGIILAALLLVLMIMLQTIFYNYNKAIHYVAIVTLAALIIYALGDVALDILHV